jgi:acyl carrier protein
MGGSQVELVKRLRELVAVQLGIDLHEVVPDARILDDLGADSLDVVELVMALEEAFAIIVPDEAIAAMSTIGDVERYVLSRAEPAAAAAL